ncbi:ninja-family protein [Musa troglodytarum]|uniref:Ninja-family protein n=1 Tax=Musa troglodytarum TaxID=320322 RepID=A0A9E7EBC6_9LILI|nr:ninja-family protein [Musa troglodytarum]
MDSLSRDFLRSFAGNGYGDSPLEATEGDSDEIELSLGLSLGGCFGVDPKGKKLVRSSSIASFSSLTTEPEFRATHAAAALTRTSSLPVAVEEERQKRKEVQSLRRLEAKRKRLERRNSIRSGAAKPGEKPNVDVNGGKESPPAAAEQMAVDNGHLGSLGGVRNGFPPPGLPTAPAAWKRPADVAGCFPPISQGSIGSQGSCSTGACGVDGRPPQETENSVRGGEEQVVAGRAGGEKELERRMMEKMPFVSTKGDGPNGRRIEGFLYKYGTGEEVRIVCVCHGSFLTPAEFVKHAGGGDVANPLRHIVVNSYPFL